MRALSGDTSDNLPGIAGIGPKFAQRLIAAYGSVEGVLEAAAAGKVLALGSSTILTLKCAACGLSCYLEPRSWEPVSQLQSRLLCVQRNHQCRL